MKKIASIVASVFFLFPLSANAAVTTRAHDGVTTYVSQVADSNPWQVVELRSAGNPSASTLVLARTDTRPYLFSSNAKLVIDDTVSDLALKKAYRNPTSHRTLENSRGVYELTAAQATALKDAKSVSLQIAFANSRTVNWKVPAKVLKEWQVVLTQTR